MTAANRPPADQNAAKGIALLVVAVLVGVVLLARFNGGGGSGGHASAPKNTTSTTVNAPTTTAVLPTGTTSKPITALKVAVFNGTGGRVAKAAGNTQKALSTAGYTNVTVGHDTDQRSTSVVYYGPTAQRGDAAAIARVMGFKNTAVQAQGTAQLPAGSTGADVVVILGLDATSNTAVAGGSTGTSTTSASSSSTTSTP
ncbi:MAG TPA: LytR C-terminal domain-containing protein [Acidimicrobiales bacterium]|jgi:hypothetical protein|nr:LytR C-terminal domain-containing protein [Acidimicrobiales bacterium]